MERHAAGRADSLERDEVVRFYLSRVTVEDLDWTTVGDDNIFTEGPVQGVSLAIFRLDFSRVARLRLNAARIRCGWTLQQQEKWKHERTQAEAEDDRAFGLSLIHISEPTRPY